VKGKVLEYLGISSPAGGRLALDQAQRLGSLGGRYRGERRRVDSLELAIVWRSWRLRVDDLGYGVRIVNWTRTLEVPWDEIDRFESAVGRDRPLRCGDDRPSSSTAE
jgi:hypothetical protein